MSNGYGGYPYCTVPYKDVGFDSPSIIDGPYDVTVKEGQTATFWVTAGGSNLRYQWQKNGIDIPGATSNTYTTPATVFADSGSLFRVIITNEYGTVTSRNALLTVIQAACNDGTAVPATHVLDIIRRAMRLLGILESEAGEIPLAQESTDFLQILNWMIEEWSNDRLIVYCIINEVFDIRSGIGRYTIGPDTSCDFNTSNPIRITTAFIRDNPAGFANDWRLVIIPDDQYQNIFQKGLPTTFPRFLHFEHVWPYGTINIWPIPNKNYQISIGQWKQFKKFTSLQDIVCLPPGYKDALSLGLAVKMAPEYSKDATNLERMLNKTLAPLKINNYQPVYLESDPVLLNRHLYNPYGDRYQ